MRYGFCTGFAVSPLFSIDPSLEEQIAGWGFDFVEYPLMSIAALDEAEFLKLKDRVQSNGLSCDCMCNLFPSSVPVIGEKTDENSIRRYLDRAFERASALGVKKIIFGSAGARHLGDFGRAEADAQFLSCLKILDGTCEKYGIKVLIEAIRAGEADYINTLREGARMVQAAQEEGCRNIDLMADLFHMQSNGEPLSDLDEFSDLIGHIHVCEQERALPDANFSEYLSGAFEILKNRGYDLTVSYESVCPASMVSGKAAAALLKGFL